MSVDQKILDALDLKKLSVPSEPKVFDMQVSHYVDSTGEDALRIWLILDEDTDVEKDGRNIAQLENALHDSLLAHGISLFPFISIAKPSELQETAEKE